MIAVSYDAAGRTDALAEVGELVTPPHDASPKPAAHGGAVSLPLTVTTHRASVEQPALNRLYTFAKIRGEGAALAIPLRGQ